MAVIRRVKGANGFMKFRLLMWKNFLQQWRHPFQTVAEVLLPIATVALVLLLRSQIHPVVRPVVTYPPIQAVSLNHSIWVIGALNQRELSLAYSPENPILDDVLRRAVVKLIMRNANLLITLISSNFTLPDFPILGNNTALVEEIISRLVNIKGYRNGAELAGIYANEETTREILAAVEFEDSLYDASSIPVDISYDLRFPERPRQRSLLATGGMSWQTDSVFPQFELPGPRFLYSWEGGNDPGYVNEMFIALQHVISIELIERITGQNLSNFNINIQRFPHPPYIEDFAIEVLQLLFPMFIMLSFSYTAVNIVSAVTVEKESQLKETMKIVGLPTWLHWTAWFCKQFFYLFLISIVCVILLKGSFFQNEEGYTDYAAFTNTPWTVLFFFINLYLTCTIFFAFMLSGFFSKGSTAALFSGVIWFISYIPAFLLSVDVEMSAAVQTVTCLSINSAMAYGFQLMLAKESTGGLQWGHFMESPSTDSARFTFGHVVIMLAVDCVVYMLIALYLEQVLPGPFGAPKPWNFFFQKSFWCKTSQNVVFEIREVTEEIKEKDPTNLPVGIKITNLSKNYGSNRVVNNLNLNIYDGQITILLGHNGAGKSTTISMLTGNVEVTSGSILLAGYEIGNQTAAARAHIGLCPQHNVIFNELTVKEHLEFFARLKGFSGCELKNDINVLIEKLELEEKRNCLAGSLSGGQKRRLCVGIAMSGAARVVLLDEPTSGMDPSSRRALWDFLQKEKKDRSIILTTHFMDEADILGDRVAIMARGSLQCIGSPYFLKQYYGVGYTLVIGKNPEFQYEFCNDLINKHLPNTPIKEDRGTEITYSLKNNDCGKFEEMLKELEKNKDTIHYKNYGLTATTLEDVFMSVGSDLPILSEIDDAITSSEHSLKSDGDLLYTEDKSDKDFDYVIGLKLYWQHFQAVQIKLWLVWTRSWMLIILQIFGPLIQIIATLGIFEYLVTMRHVIQRRPLNLNEGFTTTDTYLNYNGTSNSAIGALAKTAYEIAFNTSDVSGMKLTNIENQLVDEFYLDRASDAVEMGIMRHSVVIGATFEEEAATAWFSNFGYHDVAISLASVHSALLKAFNANASINVFNHPLEATYRDQTNLQWAVAMLSLQLASGVGSSLGIVSAVFLMFYVRERVSRAKLLQKAAGIKPIVLWGSAAVFDWFWFLIICLTLIFTFIAFQVIGLSTADEIFRVYLCFAAYGAAMIPLNYLLSHLFKGPAMGFVITFFINVLFGMMGAQIVEALMSVNLNTQNMARIIDYILQFFPLYSLVTCVRALNKIGLTKYTCLQACQYLQAVQPNQTCTMQTICENLNNSCCVRDNAYFEWEEPGMGRHFACMFVTCGVCWLILLFIEHRIIYKIFTHQKKPPPVDESKLDEDVIAEVKHVEEITTKGLAENSLVTKGLSKYYGKNLAVDQVSFSVSDTECFGLLGVNGAGKTTTFKMLMGDETISSGDAFVSGHSVKRNINKVHENIGYCPQFDAIFEELTGRENLKVFSLLRGIREDYITSMTENLAHSLGFSVHLDKRVNQYSGGNKRKLSTAVSLIGRSRLVFVDEPTSGVDAAAKRQVWRALRATRRMGRGVVLTSHSMEECEALCSMLTIMVNGRFHCYGTPQHLKDKFSQGFTLTVKLNQDDETTTSLRVTEEVKNYIQSNFRNPKLMEEYQGLLTYYLPEKTMPWSSMFGVMERAKLVLEIEDYKISQTTLEQIFLQFTKYQKEDT